MDRIFEHANDLHVRGVYIYKKASDTTAYVDEKHTVKFKTSELKDAFLKGAVINASGVLSKPIGYSEASKVGSVTYIVPNGTTATSADIAKLSAVADDAE